MSEDIVRCPYCVQDTEFRLMLRRSTTWFICPGCGHNATPEDPTKKCPCAKCCAMTRLANRCRTSEELRNRPDLPARF